jgi:4-aminobutyrate aminotransferase-like enzyme
VREDTGERAGRAHHRQGARERVPAIAQREAGERGLLLLTCGAHGNVVRMIPPLVVDAAQIDEAVQIWSEAVAATSG